MLSRTLLLRSSTVMRFLLLSAIFFVVVVVVSGDVDSTTNQCAVASDDAVCDDATTTTKTTAETIARDVVDDREVDDLWEDFGCDEVFDRPRPIHDATTWSLLRRTYRDVVGPAASFVVDDDDDDDERGGLRVPYRVVQHGLEKGRGVHAAAPVSRGTVVWSDRRTAVFRSGDAYRRFLTSLPTDLACDVLQWAYVKHELAGLDGLGIDPTTRLLVAERRSKRTSSGDREDTTRRDDWVIAVDLDPGILFNLPEDEDEDEYVGDDDDHFGGGVEGDVNKYYHGRDHHKTATRLDNVQNLGCVPEAAANVDGGCRSNLFALRDIGEGEEFLCEYGDFALMDGWELFGL